MPDVTLSTAERIEPVPGGLKRTTLVKLRVGADELAAECESPAEAAAMITRLRLVLPCE